MSLMIPRRSCTGGWVEAVWAEVVVVRSCVKEPAWLKGGELLGLRMCCVQSV